ncbi:LuxR family transcriptional regulator [Cognatiyoonia sediminum]|uniref:LuxR family transcriptional regulator n=1 Tax=Cognatiyoonia sediminum TaxID=1508389 RepID=A0A1M5MPP5_9RHOB|nr:autoinducer binding domain-containing protein [Cognatiyoonia sediminum]SHG79042.1 LuxR family transcriptional regulator [Cognatiyoonia sediminum]
MSKDVKFCSELEELSEKASKGFALAFQIRLTTPSYLFQSYSQEWNKHYSENGLLMQDPTVMWGFENQGTIRWSDLVHLDEKGVIASAADFGMKFGMTWAIANDDSRSIGSFARSDREFSDEEMSELLAIVQTIHNATLSLTPLSTNDLQALTSRGYLISQNLN